MKVSRTTLFVLILVVLVTGYNIWKNSEPGVYSETYSGYGVKLRYPEGMNFIEENFGGKPASSESGYFQGFLSDDAFFTYIQVFWNSSDAYTDPSDFVDSFLERVENSPDTITGLGSSQVSTTDGVSLYFRCFNVTDRSGVSFQGVIGSWMDVDVERYYMVAYLTSDTVDNDELANLFYTLVESVENI